MDLVAGVGRDVDDVAKLLDSSVEEGLDLTTLGHVGRDGESVSSALGDLVSKRFEAIRAAGSQNDTRALLCKMARRRRPQPAARTGDDDNLPFDACTHNLRL